MRYLAMKAIRYTAAAIKVLRKHRADADPIRAKISRYAQTGAGDVKTLVGATTSVSVSTTIGRSWRKARRKF